MVRFYTNSNIERENKNGGSVLYKYLQVTMKTLETKIKLAKISCIKFYFYLKLVIFTQLNKIHTATKQSN